MKGSPDGCVDCGSKALQAIAFDWAQGIARFPADVAYSQVFSLRLTQMNQGMNMSGLSRVQWGLSPVTSHHIVASRPILTNEYDQGGCTHQTVVCQDCSPTDSSDDYGLGSYGDHESALLVHEVHAILSGRCQHLSLLRREDAMFFHHLTAKKVDNLTQQVNPPTPILTVLENLRIERHKSPTTTTTGGSGSVEIDRKRKREPSMAVAVPSIDSSR